MTLSFHPVTGSHLPTPAMALHGLGRLGAGQGLDTGAIASIAAQGAATTGGILAGLSALGTLSPAFALAGPIGAAVLGLTAVGIAIAKIFSGCGDTCVIASQDADKLGAMARQNLDTYMAAPVHYYSLQQAALNNFDTLAQALYRACSDPQLGAAGQRCISERLVQGNPAPWCPNPGGVGCDWITQLRLPIANDPTVVPDPTPESLSSGNASSTGSGTTGAGAGTLASSTVTLPGIGNVPVLGLVGAGLLMWAVMS